MHDMNNIKHAKLHTFKMLHNMHIFEYAIYISCMYTIIYIITECDDYYSCLETM